VIVEAGEDDVSAIRANDPAASGVQHRGGNTVYSRPSETATSNSDDSVGRFPAVITYDALIRASAVTDRNRFGSGVASQPDINYLIAMRRCVVRRNNTPSEIAGVAKQGCPILF
jgi:hypothetical protein